MEVLDPATGRPLPSDSIQRVLFIAGGTHVYNIPPPQPGKGHIAAAWTADGNKLQIFTARLRVIETAIPVPGAEDKMKTDIVLEDPSNGQLFAAAPYTTEAVVEPVSDSSRFFALRVQDEAGRKASLGIGFEERSEAFDFGVALQDARRTLGWDQAAQPGRKPVAETRESVGTHDYRLKEGETITVNLPGKFRRRRPEPEASANAPLSSFSLPPPPSASSVRSSENSSFLPPPPSARSVRTQQNPNQSHQGAAQRSAEELGFDDGTTGQFA
jgi:adaptin ear-binding coat-associated protein 1/2